MERKRNSIDEKIDKLIEKNMPKGAEAKRSNLWLGSCAATVAAGLYTYMIDWNPAIRATAHLTGAFALPAGGAFVSSLAMSGIEGIANLGINLYNKKHPEKTKEPFKINPKVRNAIKQSGGTMPENLPTPSKSLKQIKKENKLNYSKMEKIDGLKF